MNSEDDCKLRSNGCNKARASLFPMLSRKEERVLRDGRKVSSALKSFPNFSRLMQGNRGKPLGCMASLTNASNKPFGRCVSVDMKDFHFQKQTWRKVPGWDCVQSRANYPSSAKVTGLFSYCGITMKANHIALSDISRWFASSHAQEAVS